MAINMGPQPPPRDPWVARRAGCLSPQAGAELLQGRWRDPVVLAVPPGGVLVGVEVALALATSLDLVIVRRIGARSAPEVAVAAVAEDCGGEPVLDVDAMEATGTYRAYVQARACIELAELASRRALYLPGRAPLGLHGRTAIVVDEGLAAGTAARAAVRAARARGAAQVVLATPVASARALEAVAPDVDALVCLSRPDPFGAVGVHYGDFRRVSDEGLLAALARVLPKPPVAGGRGRPPLPPLPPVRLRGPLN